MKYTKFLFLFLFLMILPVSYGLITPVFDDNEILINWSINYTGTYSSNTEFNWDSVFDTTSCLGTSLYNSSDVGLSFGGESGVGCVIGSLRLLSDMPDAELATWGGSNEMMVFNFSSTNENDMTRLWIRRSTHADSFYIGLNDPAGKGRIYNRGQVASAKQCEGDITNDGQSRQYIAARIESIWYLYEDDDLVCSVQSVGGSRDIFDFFFYTDPSNTNTRAIPYMIIGNGSISVDVNTSTDCQLPLLFCDEFNYLSPLSENGWTVTDIDNSFNDGFGANDSVLVWNGANPKAITQTIDPFTVNYSVSQGVYVSESTFAPVFSSSFIGTFDNNSAHKVDYKMFDKDLDLCMIIRFESNVSVQDVDVKLLNITTQEYDLLGTISKNDEHDIVINYKFNTRNKSIYPFNTSFDTNEISIFIDDGLYTFSHPARMFAECDNFKQASFVLENETSNITIDDYFVFLGTDKFTDTSSVFSFPAYDQIPQDLLDIPVSPTTGTADFAQTVENLWEQFGLLTVASRVLFGICMLVIVLTFSAVMLIKLGASGGFAAVSLFAIAGMMLILFVFLKLIPLWIFGVIALVSAALGVLALKVITQ